ncbi:MAG TPA: hypothetical protein VFA37_10820 [Gaiellaceae bacterium]|nr:hypothetical protein [Gaiellaceae bacterium]
MSGLSRALLMVALVVVAGAVVIAVRGRGSGIPSVSEVPASLPAGGVSLNGVVVLKPLVTRPAHVLSKAAAIKSARADAAKHSSAARAMEAAVTISGDPHLQSTPAWIVTFDYAKPINISGSKTPELVTHDSIFVDASTGKLLLGIYTK